MAIVSWKILLVTFVCSFSQTNAGVSEWYYRCCIKGEAKAKAYSGDFSVCEKDDLDRRRFGSSMDRMICRMAERTCCIKRLQMLSCDQGRYEAFQGKSCVRPHGYSGSDRYLRCCDCCGLGIKTAQEARVSCDDVVMDKDPLCSTVFKSCCSGQNITIQPGVHFTYAPAPTRQVVTLVTTRPTTTRVSRGCANFKCQHICREDFRNDPVCFCYNGYLISDDGKTCLDVDECVRVPNLCRNENKRCVNTKGSYRCVSSTVQPTPKRCSAGFALSQGTCKDIDECASGSLVCGRSRRCLNTVGSYRCEPCGSGYRLRNNKCEDVDECRERNFRCNSDEECRNTQGSYQCVLRPCPSGHRRQRRQCVDIDECKEGRYRCNSNEICENLRGSYRCRRCPPGYRRSSQALSCVDIDECSEKRFVCNSDEECRNTQGSYQCVRRPCPAGFKREGRQCVEIDECANGANDCSPYASCTNTRGSFRCACRSGYQGDGKTCIPRRSRECSRGFRKTNGRCVDIDECAEGTHSCASGKTCQNTRGSYTCIRPIACPKGYTRGSSGQCEDINECLYNVCSRGQTCRNLPGKYECIDRVKPDPCSGRRCPRGYQCKVIGDGRYTCEDINECLKNPCDSVATCQNLPGNYRCQCPNGYRRNLFDRNRCQDVNECSYHVCEHDCKNTIGSYQCSCRSGFKLDSPSGKYCINIDECKTQNPCQGKCRDTQGSFECSCDNGYRLNIDRKTCTDVDECRDGQGRSCSHGCTNTPGSFTCTCRRGWTLAVNKFQCIDNDECQNDPNICGGSYICLNTKGSHQCVDFGCPPRSEVPSSLARYYSWEAPNRKCVRNDCSVGDKECFAIKNKAFNLWTFDVAVGTPPTDLFTYRIVLQGYKEDSKPVLKYRFRRGNEEGLFKIDRPATLSGKAYVRNREIMTKPGFYRLEFVGEFFWSDMKLVSRYVHYLYVNVYQP